MKFLLTIIALLWLLVAPKAYGLWDNLVVSEGVSIQIGEWNFITIPEFDSQENYEVGDQFVFDGKVWEVIDSWFNPSQFLNPDGTINFNYIRTWGPIQEITDEWRAWNTYEVGDIVQWQGFEWIVRHAGANSVEPGTNTNAWNRISLEWFIYNTYEPGDIVEFNNQLWIATSTNRSRTPGEFPWAWQILD